MGSNGSGVLLMRPLPPAHCCCLGAASYLTRWWVLVTRPLSKITAVEGAQPGSCWSCLLKDCMGMVGCMDGVPWGMDRAAMRTFSVPT